MTLISFGSTFAFETTNDDDSKKVPSCDCPAEDPQANPSCGPVPAMLNKDCFSGKAATCDFLPDSPLKNLEELSHKAVLTKSYKDLLNYMSCHRRSDELFCHFKKTIAPNILLAAQASNSSPAVEACEWFQESGFYPNAQSNFVNDTGKPAKQNLKFQCGEKKVVVLKGDPEKFCDHARGYIQFVDDTVEDMNYVMKDSAITLEANMKSHLKDIESLKLALTHAQAEDIPALQRKLKRTKTYLEGSQALLAARSVWDRYWEGTPAEQIPTSFTRESLKCGNIAFAIGSMKHMYDFYSIYDAPMKKPYGTLVGLRGMNHEDAGIFNAGLFNGGAGTIAKRCKSTHSIAECINKNIVKEKDENGKWVEKGETGLHMKAIRACSAKNNWKSMSGSGSKSCEAWKCNL